jgi:glyoxylase-like metal-dependent hydrolase (beta-lactamase superfamily II)
MTTPRLAVRVISIGALSANPLWGERAPVRTGYATTSLILAADRRILVDPGLPDAAMVARLSERTNLKPTDITDIFLTSFRPDTRRSLRAFEHAEWWIGQDEREALGVPLAHWLRDAIEKNDESLIEALREDVAILAKFKPAADQLAPGVALFPLPGVTPGLCGLLIEEQRFTTLICGDAIPNIEYLEQGQVLQGAHSVDMAKASFAEAVEIADMLIPGRDNIVVNPVRRAM